MIRIFRLTERGMNEFTQWDDAIAANEIETVATFAHYENAVQAFEQVGYDTDFYGIGPL